MINSIQFAFHEKVPSVAPAILNNYTDCPKEYLKKMYDGGYHSQLNNVQHQGGVKFAGWFYDFRPFLKKYLYKQYGRWCESYAPNKTLLRKSVYGRVDKIVELED